MKPRTAQAIVFAAGLLIAAAGVAILIGPGWFFDTVGHFPPYNRHYMGDAAAFSLPIGVGLLWAARDLRRHRPLIGVAAAASGIHTLNHVVDALGQPPAHWLLDVAPLLFVALGLGLVWQRTEASHGVSRGSQ